MAKVDGVQLKPEDIEVVLTKPCQYFQSSIEEARREIEAKKNEDIFSLLSTSNDIDLKVPNKYGIQIETGHFKSVNHFYPQVLNSKIHPLVAWFFSLGNERIINRYKQMNPNVKTDALREILNYKPKHFRYAGSDLFKVVDANGKKQMIIIETNSCPSGQKSMPLITESNKFGGYKTIIESAFESVLRDIDRSFGDLAIVYDKNKMEASAYCSVLAELSGEKVWFVEYYDDDKDESSRSVIWRDGLMYIKDKFNNWHPIRACLRYVTQKPWKRIPLNTKTLVINPIIACLAGGRNKIMAAHAYQMLNQELRDTGLEIRVPVTNLNVNKDEIPSHIEKMGGHAVIKEPYGNCGVGVYTITNQKELAEFMNTKHHYNKFIVQSLVGHSAWTCDNRREKDFYHIGTVSNKNNQVFVYDLRMVVTANKNGFIPVSMNCRRARDPLEDELCPDAVTWNMLGTNLSIKIDKNIWDTESERLLLMDQECFDQLGMGIDDLIDSYVQTVLAMIAIDKMCVKLLNGDENRFNYELYEDLNFDDALFKEMKI